MDASWDMLLLDEFLGSGSSPTNSWKETVNFMRLGSRKIYQVYHPVFSSMFVGNPPFPIGNTSTNGGFSMVFPLLC